MVEADSYYIGAYWGPRREGFEEIAKKLTRCIVNLRGVSVEFEEWRTSYGLPSSALSSPAGLNGDAIDAAVAEVGPSGERRPEELGSLVTLVTGRAASIGFEVSAGGYSRSLMNTVLLNLPDSRAAPALVNVKTLPEIVTAIVDAWVPDWAVCARYDLLVDRGPGDFRRPDVGWLTYLSSNRDPRPLNCDGVKIRELMGGSLLTIGSDPESISREQVFDVYGKLLAAGALESTPIDRAVL